MDRRSALKKLGVGGAVAVGAPVLLDAFNVAHACSPASATSAVPTRPIINGNATVISFDVAAFNCGPTDSLNFVWRIISSTPTIETITTSGPSATIKKANPQSGNPANFVIEVDVRNGTTLVATYELEGSPTAPLAVRLL